VILVDSNIFTYAAGREHANRRASGEFLERVAQGTVKAAIDAEVLQEVVRRYTALKRWEKGRLVYDAARTLFPDVLPVTAEVKDGARRLLDSHPGMGARDAVHAAVVDVYGLKGICSYDRDFDRIRICGGWSREGPEIDDGKCA
jgi:predicted nucleic acid-binding protein